MDFANDILRFLHILSFVFMSVPLFNLIIVNERASLSKSFAFEADRYMENIIGNGAYRCFAYQCTVLITGVLLLFTGPLGIESIWTSWVVGGKVVLLAALMGLLSYVHFNIQPRIESIFSQLSPGSEVPERLATPLKRYRVRRKRLATGCLFLVIASVIMGLQVYATFTLIVNAILIALAALFALRANKTLLRFGWV